MINKKRISWAIAIVILFTIVLSYISTMIGELVTAADTFLNIIGVILFTATIIGGYYFGQFMANFLKK